MIKLSSGRHATLHPDGLVTNDQASGRQWQPTLSAHDPNPPITIEGGAFSVTPSPLAVVLALTVPAVSSGNANSASQILMVG